MNYHAKMSKGLEDLSQQDKDNLDAFATEGFIKPLEERGFKFVGYSHTEMGEKDGGIHILQFENVLQENPITRRELEKICIQDDDNQPYSSYGIYFRTLWVFVPYFA